MTEMQSNLEGQLGFLTEQVEFLKNKVDDLSSRLQSLESGKSFMQKPDEMQAEAVATKIETKVVPKAGVLKKAGTGSLLPRVATVCFIMVVALILRTITDNEIVDTQLGSILGMGYATALILVGGWFYLKKAVWRRFSLPADYYCFFP